MLEWFALAVSKLGNHLIALDEEVLSDAPVPVPQEVVYFGEGNIGAIHD